MIMETPIVYCVIGVDNFDGPILQTMKIYSNERDALSYQESLQHQISNRDVFGIHYVYKFSREIITLTHND